MNIQSEKKSIINRFKQIEDVSLIKAIRNLLDYAAKKELKDIDDSTVVGYEGNGNPITIAQLIADIETAETEISQGKYLTIEELQKDAEQW